MKKIITILLLVASFITNAQEKKKDVETVSFKVLGTCEQCKKRIENAADIKGVKNAEWNVKTQVMKVTYRADKVTEAQIKQAILNAGHDVDDQKATTTSYENLPECCKYRVTDKSKLKH